MIKVLIVEDLAVMREFLVHVLGSDPDIQVIGSVNNGEEALKAMKKMSPDVITMDINMPKMNGFEATRQIMETNPTPIVIVSASWDPKEVATTFRAVEAGAVAVLEKPRGIGHPDYENTVRNLIQTVKLMSEVKVVKRWARHRQAAAVSATPLPLLQEDIKEIAVGVKVVAVGSSTGGPLVLQTILSRLPGNYPYPILVVQHMAAGFIQGFAEWLGQSSGLSIQVAARGNRILPGHVYIAPDGFQMGVEREGKIVLAEDEPENSLRPSVSYLFRSVAKVYGKNAVGVLLTGMGKDGAEELKFMRKNGALTIAQDKESSIVHGMPGEAIKLDAATYVYPPEKIASMLAGLVKNER